jgi:hypothetical protein
MPQVGKTVEIVGDNQKVHARIIRLKLESGNTVLTAIDIAKGSQPIVRDIFGLIAHQENEKKQLPFPTTVRQTLPDVDKLIGVVKYLTPADTDYEWAIKSVIDHGDLSTPVVARITKPLNRQ